MVENGKVLCFYSLLCKESMMVLLEVGVGDFLVFRGVVVLFVVVDFVGDVGEVDV